MGYISKRSISSENYFEQNIFPAKGELMNKYTKLIFSASLAFFMTSCGNFQMPESISVKTDAKFQVPLGTATYDLSKTISPKAMREKIQESLGNAATVYDYIDPTDSDTLNYFIRFNGMSADVDVGKYLDGLNLDDALGDLGQSFSFKAGDPINYSQKKNIQLPDFAEQLTQTPSISINDWELTEGTINLPEENMPKATITGTPSDATYERIFYSAGELKLTFTKTDGTPYTSGYELNLNAKIYENDGTTLLTQSGLKNIAQNPVISIPLTSSKGIPKDFKILFEGNSKNGSTSIIHTFSSTAEFVNLTPTKAVGVTANSMGAIGLSDDVLDQSQPVQLSNIPSELKSMTFDNAELKLKIAMPRGWSGVSLELPDSNGLAIDGPTDSSLTKTSSNSGSLLDCTYSWGATINGSTELTIKIHPVLKLDNATIVLENGKTNLSIPCETNLSLTNIKSATVDLEALGASGFSLPTDGSDGSIELPESLLKFVKGINFNEYKTDSSGTPTTTKREGFGLKCTVTNTLPAGNDIPLILQAFDNQDTSGYYYNLESKIDAGVTNKQVSWTTYPNVKFPEADGSPKYLPFNVIIKNASNFTLKDIQLGKEYQMKIKLDKFVCDWDSVKLNLSSIEPFSGDIPIDFSVSSLMKDFSVGEDLMENIGLNSFPLYLLAQKSEDSTIFNGMNLNGKMYVSYKQNNTIKYIDVLNNEAESKPTSPKAMNIIDTVPWPEDATKEIKGNESDKTNLAYYLKNSSAKGELKQILSLKDASDIKLNYEVSVGGGSDKTIYRSSINSESPETLAVDYGMMLSFDFTLAAPISVNIMEFADENYNKPDDSGNYSDILQREDASSYEDFMDYMDAIDYVGISYTVNNKLIKNLDLMAKIDDTNGKTELKTSLVFSPGHHTEKFTKAQIENVMTKYPFHPDMVIQLGRNLTDAEKSTEKYATAERLKISRAGVSSSDALSAQIIVVVQMDGSQPISVWQNN